MSTSRSLKIQAAKAASKARHNSQAITIGKNWKVLRADAMNWMIQYKGEFYGYYGKLSHALNDLPVKMLGEEAKNSLQEVQRSLQAIHETIKKAISDKIWGEDR
jgi:hypothetical protein